MKKLLVPRCPLFRGSTVAIQYTYLAFFFLQSPALVSQTSSQTSCPLAAPLSHWCRIADQAYRQTFQTVPEGRMRQRVTLSCYTIIAIIHRLAPLQH